MKGAAAKEMPVASRYFFHLRRKKDIVRDLKGEEVQGTMALWDLARIKARDHLAAALFADEDYSDCVLEVTSEQGTLILQMPILRALTM